MKYIFLLFGFLYGCSSPRPVVDNCVESARILTYMTDGGISCDKGQHAEASLNTCREDILVVCRCYNHGKLY